MVVASAGEHTHRRVVSMHDDGCGWALVSTTAAGSPPGTRGAMIARLARTPGTTISLMPTCVPITGCGAVARPVTVIRSQPVAPRGTRSGWRAPVTWTGSVTRPVADVTVTCVTGGPSAGLSVNATWITRGPTGESKPSWIHWPTGPPRLPDSHIVRMLPSTAEYGSSPLAHWPGMAPMPAADEDAVTVRIP